MNSHPEDNAPAKKSAPPSQPATTSPQPHVIALARPRSWTATVLALVLGAAGSALWLGLREFSSRREDESSSPAFSRAGRNATPPVAARPALDARRSAAPPGMVDISPLRGEGLTVAEFMVLIEKAAASPVKCEVLKTPIGALRFSAYDGLLQIPVREALGMLRYAGLAVEQTQKDEPIKVNPIHSKERTLELLTAGADPDGPDWGALRPWRSFRVSSTLNVGALVASTEGVPEAGSVSALAWAMPGAQHLVSVADDGRVTQECSAPLSRAELQAAEKLFVKLACLSGDVADPATRAAAVSGLGELLRLNSQAQLPGVSAVVRALGVLLKDKDTEVSRSAALAAGNSAAVEMLALLVEQLLERRTACPDQAVALVALTHAESLGRRLDREALGAGNWERRRVLFQTVGSWLAGAPQLQPAGGDAAGQGDAENLPARQARPGSVAQEQPLSQAETQSAAWLRAAAVFCPSASVAERTQAIEQRLWQGGNTQAQLVVLSADRTGERLGAAALPAPLQVAVAAGPLWPRSRFSLEQAAAWVAGNDSRWVQAALWRLSRVEQRWLEKALSGAENTSLVSTLMTFATNSPSPILRRLAVEALYRERQQKNAEGTGEKFRLCWDTRPALRSFMDDKDRAVQTAAAGAVGRLGDSTELSEMAQPGLRDRAPEAVARLLETLAERLIKSTGQTPELTQAIVAIADMCLEFGNDAVEQQAGRLRMNEPEMSLEAKVRLASSFKKAPARAGGIRVLGVSGARADWTIKLVSHLLADNSPDARAAVFQSRLPARVSPKEDVLKLWLKGLRDGESQVRLAALKALGPATQQPEAMLQCIGELAASDPEAEVRAYAASMLPPKQDKPGDR